MSEVEREDGEVYQKDGKWYVHAPAFDTFGPFDDHEEAVEKSYKYSDWLAAMDAN